MVGFVCHGGARGRIASEASSPLPVSVCVRGGGWGEGARGVRAVAAGAAAATTGAASAATVAAAAAVAGGQGGQRVTSRRRVLTCVGHHACTCGGNIRVGDDRGWRAGRDQCERL